ncbi:MAG: imidazoleglycerol-phosphate dehydratase HisB [Defluviitaleaceae bacterium]|nr:imidazoleglycerol-phosphate dehydratase HisB [Defluviitaleaceae bacterium]
MRKAVFERNTKETSIKLALNLDEAGQNKISTGIGFFDHMLELMAFRAGFSLSLECEGDLNIDTHHTVEDVGICLGTAFKDALGDKAGINRYGSCAMPMDEALVSCVLDISNRGFLVFNAPLPAEVCGTFETEGTEEFLRAFAVNAGITLHVNLAYGINTHHIIEAIFKGAGGALRQAIAVTGAGVSSTKGVL